MHARGRDSGLSGRFGRRGDRSVALRLGVPGRRGRRTRHRGAGAPGTRRLGPRFAGRYPLVAGRLLLAEGEGGSANVTLPRTHRPGAGFGAVPPRPGPGPETPAHAETSRKKTDDLCQVVRFSVPGRVRGLFLFRSHLRLFLSSSPHLFPSSLPLISLLFPSLSRSRPLSRPPATPR